MTCIVRYTTKKAFKEAVASEPHRVHIEDPSIVCPRDFTAADIQTGQTEYVTNHPKRSWFANVRRAKDGTLKVA